MNATQKLLQLIEARRAALAPFVDQVREESTTLAAGHALMRKHQVPSIEDAIQCEAAVRMARLEQRMRSVLGSRRLVIV